MTIIGHYIGFNVTDWSNNVYPLTGLENYEKDKGVLNGIGVKTPINRLTDIKIKTHIAIFFLNNM